MWNGKMKAFTLSYDDGVEQDKRMIAILNKYGIKGTFNLNGSRHVSKTLGFPWLYQNEVVVARMPIEDLQETYVGHEIAMHAYNHAQLDLITPEECRREILVDRLVLTRFFGKEPVGFAYPCGTYNDTAVDILRELGVKYARGYRPNGTFDIPTDFLRWDCTCGGTSPELMNFAKKFVEMKPDKPQLFTICGHSYGFDYQNKWAAFEEFCEFISGRDDIFYGTNAECLLGE